MLLNARYFKNKFPTRLKKEFKLNNSPSLAYSFNMGAA